MNDASRLDAATTMVEVRGLNVWYGEECALRDVSLAVPRGTIAAIIGPSGCGKTSFLNCLNRLSDLVPGCRFEGGVHIAGEDVRAPGADVMDLRRRVGMIFQQPNPFPLSIRRNLELPLIEHGLRDRTALKEAVEQALRDAGLWDEVKDRLERSALALSGGQQQRLCIARAIALEPEVLLMDEPCSALDPIASGVVEDLLLRFKGRYTLVMVTHNLAQARRVADCTGVFWLRDGAGRLLEFGPTPVVFEAPRDPVTAAYVAGLCG
ncbi:MAG: phosphate ABC transporter ATP-binding protein [Nevskiales bacterium]